MTQQGKSVSVVAPFYSEGDNVDGSCQGIPAIVDQTPCLAFGIMPMAIFRAV